MTDMNKPSLSVPFSTIPPNQYIRVSAHPDEVGGSRSTPTPLLKALTKECSPFGWSSSSIVGPLNQKMREKFEDADLLRKVAGHIPPSVRQDELVQMKGTDKPAVLGKDEKPIMFVRIVTPRYTKDTAEMGLKPDLIDKIIIQSGVDMANAVARAFIEGLDTVIDKLDPLTSNPLIPARDLRNLDELKEGTFSLLIHPDTVDGLGTPDTVTDIHISEEVPRDRVYVLPNSMVISYRNLQQPQFWIDRKAYMVEFYCWVEVGSTLSKMEGLCSLRLPKTEMADAT